MRHSDARSALGQAGISERAILHRLQIRGAQRRRPFSLARETAF